MDKITTLQKELLNLPDSPEKLTVESLAMKEQVEWEEERQIKTEQQAIESVLRNAGINTNGNIQKQIADY